jgi:hypothetical protein
MTGAQLRMAEFFDEQIGSAQPAGQLLEQLVPCGGKIGLVHDAYALCLGQDVHIEVKPVNQAEDGLFAADDVVRREGCHC